MKICVKNLSKNYGNSENFVAALKPSSFEILDGEKVAVIGTSGSGTTTLLHLLGGLEKPSTGEIKYDENLVTSFSETELASFRLKHIGFVFQTFNLIPELTAYENIILPAMLNSIKPDTDYIGVLVNRLDISNRLSHFPGQLSGGQQQRVAIARALTNKPEILLCDEPTGNLDTKNSHAVIDLIKDISDMLGITLVLVTHDTSLVTGFSRIFKIEDGQIGEAYES